MAQDLEVRRSRERFVTRAPGRETWHSFSFGEHYDPDNVGFGVLVAHNEDLLAGGAGYDDHPHRDLEILTWVLEGSLRHEDSHGHRGVVGPGMVQRLSAGSGVVHAERNASPVRPARLVQMWVAPDRQGLRPSYEVSDLRPALTAGGWVVLASGRPEHAGTAAVTVHSSRATLRAARLPAGGELPLEEAPYRHLFVARGRVELEGWGDLDTSDAARIVGGGRRTLRAVGAVEVLLWEMHARPR